VHRTPRTPDVRMTGSAERPSYVPSSTSVPRQADVLDCDLADSQWSFSHQQASTTSDLTKTTDTPVHLVPGGGAVVPAWRQAVRGSGLPWRTIVTTVRREVMHTRPAHSLDMRPSRQPRHVHDDIRSSSYPQTYHPTGATHPPTVGGIKQCCTPSVRLSIVCPMPLSQQWRILDYYRTLMLEVEPTGCG